MFIFKPQNRASCFLLRWLGHGGVHGHGLFPPLAGVDLEHRVGFLYRVPILDEFGEKREPGPHARLPVVIVPQVFPRWGDCDSGEAVGDCRRILDVFDFQP